MNARNQSLTQVAAATAATIDESPVGRSFCLFVELEPGYAGGEPRVIGVPTTTTALLCDHVVSTAPGRHARGMAFEPLLDVVPPVLVLTAPPSHKVFVNGAEIGSTHALEVGDVVSCDGAEVRLHVSLRHRPHVGAPREEHIGRECAVCLTPVEADTAERPSRVLVCASCEAVMHDEARLTDDAADGDVLECARVVTSCPVCNSKLVRTEGFSYVPEL